MNLSPADQEIQYIAWFLTLVEFVLAIYVLLLNIRHSANRHTGVLLLILALDSFIIGGMMSPQGRSQIIPVLDAIITPVFNPFLFLVTVVLLKPQWVSGRRKWVLWLIYALCLVPVALTLMDLAFDTRLWYTGLPAAYTGGYFELAEAAGGLIAAPIRLFSFQIMGLMPSILILYVLLRSRKEETKNRQMIWLLLASHVLAVILLFALRGQIGGAVSVLGSSLVYALAYAYATFQQMISERRLQRGRLPIRLTLLITAITVPLFVAVVLFVNFRAQSLLQQEALERLNATNETTVNRASVWLDLNVRALQNLVLLPEITSMDPVRQRPALQTLAATYPYMYLVSTTDMTGINVARSDDADPKDYHDRAWFIGARDGAPVTYQVVIGRTSGQSALVVSVPIRDQAGQIIGVGMFATTLENVSAQMQLGWVGDAGYTYIVDAENRLVAHPDPQVAAEVLDLSDYPPVAALRRGSRGAFTFTDPEGRSWQAHLDGLENGWGIVTQQPQDELLVGVRAFQLVSWITLAVTVSLLLVMSWLIVRQAMYPIGSLTETARALAAGDLTAVAPVESEDELGLLARTMNGMTAELRGLIGSLEARVADRTAELARRSAQLEAAATIARAAAAIRDVGELLDETVRLISDRFGFYHAGIFLLDDTGEYAVLRAASSEGGRRMLARGHKLLVGKVGIVGAVAGSGQPRIALDVGADAVFFDNPDLPHTRSEMALPLRVQERLIGVLDVQSVQESAFSEEDVAVLQTLADQVALAIQSARLLEESRRAVLELQTIYSKQVSEAWQEQATVPAFAYDRLEVVTADPDAYPIVEQAIRAGDLVMASEPESGRSALAIPLRLRNQVIGAIALEELDEVRQWTTDEIELVRTVSEQVALALESARLYADTRRRAEEQEVLTRIAAIAGSTLDLDAMLEQLMREARRMLGAEFSVLLLADEARQALVARYIGGEVADPTSLSAGWVIPFDTPGFANSIFARGGAYYSALGLDDPNVIPAYLPHMRGLGVRNFCGVALRVREQSIGELYVGNRPGGFGADELRLLRAVAGYVSNAIENARLFAQTVQRADQERLISEITGRIRASTNLEAVVQTTAQELGRALRAARVLVRVGLAGPDQPTTERVTAPADGDDGSTPGGEA